MGNIQVNSNKEGTGSVRKKLADVLEDMWKKIGLHHHSVNGDVKLKKKKALSKSEDDNSLVYQINLPDMKARDISVEIEDGRLVVFGAHREQSSTVSKHYVSTTQTIRHFEQSFLMPADAECEDTDARFKKGILTLTVPRKSVDAADG